jgi:hypothetical protein
MIASSSLRHHIFICESVVKVIQNAKYCNTVRTCLLFFIRCRSDIELKRLQPSNGGSSIEDQNGDTGIRVESTFQIQKSYTTTHRCLIRTTMMTRILTIALFSSLAAHMGSAFQTAPGRLLLAVQQRRSTAVAMATDEERAAALSEYLVKAHQEKLKAIQTAEGKKETEIQALKADIEALRAQKPAGSPSSALTSTAAAASTGDLMDLSKEDLVTKVTQYQAFMANYVVKAQNEKFKAVKAAEQAAAQKYGLVLSGGASAAPATTGAPSPEEISYAKRNAAVSAAAAAGKSRWGDLESQRAAGGVAALEPTVAVAAAVAPASARVVSAEVKAAVVAADHGLRADGGVGGLTLSERVNMGAKAAGGKAAPNLATAGANSPENISYVKRNAHIAAAAAAGKSRWGAMESQRVAGCGVALKPNVAVAAAVAPAPARLVPAEVEAAVVAADHGLRADGGVGGLTLSERVNMGAKAAGGKAAPALATAGAISPENISYAKRNAHIAAAASAGKSRWGAMENERIKKLISLPAGSTDSPPKAAAAAVTLEERVNLGARLLAK